MTRAKRNWNAINHYAYLRWRKAQKAKCQLFWVTMFRHNKEPEMAKGEGQ